MIAVSAVHKLRDMAGPVITFIAMSDSFGGGEIVTLRVASALNDSFEVRVIARPGSKLLSEAEKLGIETLPVDLGPKLGRRTAFGSLAKFRTSRSRLTNLLRQMSSNDWCVLQYKWEELLWGGVETAPHVLLWEHGPIPSALLKVPVLRQRLRRAFVQADAVVAWSEPAWRSIKALSGRDSKRLNAGIQPESIASALTAAPEWRARLLLDSSGESLLVSFAGRVTHDKGIDLVIAALPLMPGAVLAIAGQGPALRDLYDQASSLGVDSRVHFLGHLDDPLPLTAASDVAVLLSSSPGEGRPLAALEAIALGTPLLGLESSPALRALAEEAPGISLVSDASPDLVARGLRVAARTAIPHHHPRTWAEVADDIIGIIG